MTERKRLSKVGASGRSRLENLRLRAAAMAAFRRAMERRGILEMESPTLIRHPGLEPHLEPIEIPAEGFLSTSPEYQMKRLLAGGSGSIYYLGKAFRRGERGPHHNQEFTMAEWYSVGVGYRSLMVDTSHIVAEVAQEVLGSTRVTGPDGEPLDLEPPWEVVTVSEAFSRHAGVDLCPESDEVWDPPTKEATDHLRAAARGAGVRVPEDATWEESFFRVFVQLVEPALKTNRPVILCDWPVTLAALSQLRDEGDRFVAERFEVSVGGLELANAFGELRDPGEQRRRLVADKRKRRSSGKPVFEPDELFLEALGEGMPHCSGIALGFDRLVMLLAGAREIQEVMAFVYEEL